MDRKIMTSVKLQKQLHYKVQQRVISDGYGMRGKSRWIIEAIEDLLQLSDYPTLADIADDMDQLSEMITIRLSEDLMTKLDRAIIQVRKHYPAMEGVKSNLIRASIIQRLIRCTASVTE
jgi:hypothetical protein